VDLSGKDKASHWVAVIMASHVPGYGKVERRLDLCTRGGWALGTRSVTLYDIINTDAGGLW
jgi:hypothetical protein